MDFLSFLAISKSEDFLKNKTICFKGKKDNYSLLFFSLFFQQLKKTFNISVKTLSHEVGIESIIANLSTSFLGNTSFYWLKNISDFKLKKNKKLISFLKDYAGPNGSAFFIDETVLCSQNDFDLTISVPEKIEQKTFLKIAEFLEFKISLTNTIKLFNKNKVINLDSACLLMQYSLLNGRQIDSFINEFMNKIVEPEHSLLELSTTFFARDTKKFFSLWLNMADDYSSQFWIAFWSEQLWRAFNFIELSKKRQFYEAKRVSFRLPYNFTQRLWQKVDKNKLRDIHDLLYSVDCSLKNGGKPFSLELIYYQYFQ